MHWVAGDEVIELGQLKHRFYTPGLLARSVPAMAQTADHLMSGHHHHGHHGGI